MAEGIDLDEWELLSHNSSSRDEFDEDDFTYFESLSNNLEIKGEIFDSGKSIESDSHQISDTPLNEISDCSQNLDSGKNGSNECSNSEIISTENKYLYLERVFDEKDGNFDKDLGVHGNLDTENSIEELGFGESEVLDAFCSNEINYEKNKLKITKDLEKPISAMAFEGVYNLNLICSNEIDSEINDEMVNSNNLGGEENKEIGGAKKQICKAQNENKGLIWWKMPIDVIKYYFFGIKPVWSVSLAMGFLGFLMITHKLYLYKMNKQQDKTLNPPIKVHFDEKKRAIVQARAARLNKGLTIVKRDPIIRTPIPGFGVTLFPAMNSLQWAP